MTKKRFALLALAAAMALVIAGCGDSSSDTTVAPATTAMEDMTDTSAMGDMTDTSAMGDMGEDDHEEHVFDFGEPGVAVNADRVIELTASDDFRYSPDALVVSVGETITFRVTNSGAIAHDFLLGRSDLQDEHDIEMAEMGGMAMADEPNAFTIEPGETRDLTWHFTEAGEVLIGCHVVGHYAAGMKATISVNA